MLSFSNYFGDVVPETAETALRTVGNWCNTTDYTRPRMLQLQWVRYPTVRCNVEKAVGLVY